MQKIENLKVKQNLLKGKVFTFRKCKKRKILNRNVFLFRFGWSDIYFGELFDQIFANLSQNSNKKLNLKDLELFIDMKTKVFFLTYSDNWNIEENLPLMIKLMDYLDLKNLRSLRFGMKFLFSRPKNPENLLIDIVRALEYVNLIMQEVSKNLNKELDNFSVYLDVGG